MSLRRTGLALTLTFALGACSNQITHDDRTVSEEARQEALEQAAMALRADAALDASRLVADLSSGPAVGLATESAGMSMELPDDLPLPASKYSLGSRLVEGAQRQKRLDLRYASHKSDPEPGDLLFEFTETNLDGSVTTVRVIQDEPLAVVQISADTTWPNGHLLLASTHEELFVDRGAALDDDADDVLLSLRSDLNFLNGAQLARFVDERAEGGIVDDARIELTSRFSARPGHPRLVDIESVFTVDLHQLANESDDRFVSVRRDTRFAGTAHDGGNARIEERLMPSEPIAEGEEACGGEASRAIYFRADSQLVDWVDEASLDCQGGGTLARRIRYADGSADQLSISENAEGVVTLNAVERSGATTHGSFDPNSGSFQVQSVFAPGSDPLSRDIQGQSEADGSVWSLDEELLYADGFVERNHLEGSQNEDGKRLAGSHAGRDESLEFELEANAEETQLSGWIENDRGVSLEFDVELLPDGGHLLDFVAINPTTRVEGHFEVGADGCGSGTLIVEEGNSRATIDVVFCGERLQDESGRVVQI